MLTPAILITLIAISITVFFGVISQPNEILSCYVRYVNESKLPELIIKLLTCPWCISFWIATGLVFYFGYDPFKLLFSVTWSVILTYVILNKFVY